MRLPLCLAMRSLSRNADDPARSGGVAALQRPIEPATTVARTRSQFRLGRLAAARDVDERPQVTPLVVGPLGSGRGLAVAVHPGGPQPVALRRCQVVLEPEGHVQDLRAVNAEP